MPHLQMSLDSFANEVHLHMRSNIYVSVDIIIVIDVDLKMMSVILHIVSTIVCVALIKPW